MQDDRGDLSLFNNGHWKAQPRWVKVLTILVGVPAWLVLMAAVFSGNTNATVETVALGAFVAALLAASRLRLPYLLANGLVASAFDPFADISEPWERS